MQSVTWPWTTPTNAESVEEAALLRQVSTQPAAFAPLYEHYCSRVYAYCLRRTGHLQEAEDLTSLIFTRALAGAAAYRGGSVAAWLFRIAHHTVANYHREQVRHPALSLDALTTLPLPALDDPLLDGLVQAEERAVVARLLLTLSEEARELFLLRVAEGLSAREVGAILGKSEGAVRVAVHRILQQLRTHYQQTTGETQP